MRLFYLVYSINFDGSLEEDLSLPISKGVTLHTARSTLFTPNMKGDIFCCYFIAGILNSVAVRSTLFLDLDLHQPTQMDDVKTMLKKYKRLRREEPVSLHLVLSCDYVCIDFLYHPLEHAPSLDITGIDLDDVYERAGVLAQSEKIKQTMEALEKNLKK